MSTPLSVNETVRASISLRSKMLLLVAIVFFGFSVVVILGQRLLEDVRIGSSTYLTIRTYQKTLEKIAYLKSDFNRIRAEYLSVAEESSPEIRVQQLDVIAGLNAEIDKNFKSILVMIPEEKRKPLLDAQDEWKVFSDNMTGKIVPAILAGDRVLALERLQSIQRHRYNRFVANLDMLITALNDLAVTSEKSAEIMVKERIFTIMCAGCAIFFIVLLLSLGVSLLIVRPLRSATEFTSKVSNGDLSELLVLKSRDEVGILAAHLNSMVLGLNALVGKIGGAAKELTHVAEVVTVSSKNVSNETTLQVASLTQVSNAAAEMTTTINSVLNDVNNLAVSNSNSHSAVAEMASNISEVATWADQLQSLTSGVAVSVETISVSIQALDENIEQLNGMSKDTATSVILMNDTVKDIEQKAALTSELAEHAAHEAIIGQKAVSETIASMEKIGASSRVTCQVIEELSASIEDIGAIVSVIDEINARTALLALNARIISAQTGSAGQAFSVVAEEFKSLSQRTASSTDEIALKIERVQEQSRRVVTAIRNTEDVVASGGQLAKKSGEALSKIVGVVQQTSSQMEAISKTTALQSEGSKVIEESIRAVTETMDQVASTSNSVKQESTQIAVATEQLNLMTTQVMHAISENKIAARHIADASENISSMIERIQTSCSEETSKSNRILAAIREIRSAMDNNQTAAHEAYQASDDLTCQISGLLASINGFKLHSGSAVEAKPRRLTLSSPTMALPPSAQAAT